MRLAYPVHLRDDGTGQTLGYATLSRNLQRALGEAGVVWDDAAPVALHVCPPFAYQRGPEQVSAVMTMWETSVVPPEQIAPLRAADLVLVPSEFCRMSFQRSGLRRPLTVCPLGLWPDQWPYVQRVHRPHEPFKFLWMGQASERKGWNLAVEAFMQAFRPDAPVMLTLKTSPNDPKIGVQGFTHAGLVFDPRRLSQPELRQLVEQQHALVYPSLAEGFGLIPLECMASGMLVIAPRTSGMAEFVHKGVAWCLETKPVRVRYGVETTVPQPKLSHLVALMRRAVVDYDETQALRARASAWAHQFTWARTAQGVQHALALWAAKTEAA